MLPYLAMVASVIEGRTIRREELLQAAAAKYETTQLRQAAAARICSSLSQPTPALTVRPMSETVERSSLDLRYEGYRLRNDAAEARLLASIAERGIEEPLGGVDTPQGRLLLDGFRRNRCAAKLGIECVPYVSWGEDETQGIASLLSARRQRTLSILEQARFVDELLCDARDDDRRRGRDALAEQGLGQHASQSAHPDEPGDPRDSLSRRVSRLLVHGHAAAVHAHERRRPSRKSNASCRRSPERSSASARSNCWPMDTSAAHRRCVRPSTRATGNGRSSRCRQVAEDPEGLSEFERGLLRELERLLQAMQKVMTRCDSPRLQTRDFFAQANLLLASLLGRRDSFFKKMEEFYDRTGRA